MRTSKEFINGNFFLSIHYHYYCTECLDLIENEQEGGPFKSSRPGSFYLNNSIPYITHMKQCHHLHARLMLNG